MVGRNPDIAGAQRKPCHANSASTADFDRCGETAPAYERHERGSIDGPNIDRAHNGPGAWNPAPGSAYNGPATVVKRRKTPGLIFHPSPAPWCDVSPASIVVRSPANGDAIRNPNMAVHWIGAPRAVVVQILVADNVGRYILGGHKPIFTLISRQVPLLKIVRGGQRLFVIADLIRAGKYILESGCHIVCLSACGYFPRTVLDCEDAGRSVG